MENIHASSPDPVGIQPDSVNLSQSFEMNSSILRFANFDLVLPQDHRLIKLSQIQPLRDANVAVSSKYLSIKYPEKAIFDIGANIGDTAAMIAIACRNKIYCAEPNKEFAGYLKINSKSFANNIVIFEGLIGDGRELFGQLISNSGNAYFKQSADCQEKTKTHRISEVVNDRLALIKIDTEGSDRSIVLSNLDKIKQDLPGILFECHASHINDLYETEFLLNRLQELGYQNFIAWDDPGYHMISTSDEKGIIDLLRYTFIRGRYRARSIYYLDILALHKRDKDVYSHITQAYTKDTVKQELGMQ